MAGRYAIGNAPRNDGAERVDPQVPPRGRWPEGKTGLSLAESQAVRFAGP